MIAVALAAALLLSDAPAEEGYDALVSRGVTLGREGRYEEAARTLAAAVALDASRPEALVERGGLRFLEKRYEDAVRDLRAALRLREDDYTRDLLASSLHLAGRSDEALSTWNPLGRPVVGEIEIGGLVHTIDRVARREVTFAAGEVLTLDRVRETRLRLADVGVFDRVTVRPVPLGDGKADVTVALLERHGLFRGPVDLVANVGTNLLFERARPRYWNIAGTGISVGGQYRWEKNRPDLSVQIDWPRPLGLGANLRVSAFRGRQLYDLGEPLLRRSRGLDVSLRRVLGSRTAGHLAFRTRDRSFSRADPDAPGGDIVGFELGLDRVLLDTQRQRVDGSLRLLSSARAFGSQVPFSRGTLSISYRAFLKAPEGALLERSVFAARIHAGHGGDGMPVDEMFAPGGSPEMELPLRAHRQTRNGTLGTTPLGRSLTLTNFEWRVRLVRSALIQGGVVLFYDAASIRRAAAQSDQDHVLHDIGMGIRLALGGSSILRFDYGHGLSDGQHAFFMGLNQIF